MTMWQIKDNKFDFSISHTIVAPRQVVYEVLADLEAYPEFVNDLISVQRAGKVYKFMARAALLTIPVTVAVIRVPHHSILFELVEGPVDALTGAWLIEAGDTPEQTKVTLTIHAETDQRGEWLLRMTGRFVQNKTDKLVQAFSQRVAELQRGEVKPALTREAPEARGMMAWFKNLGQPRSNRPAAQAPEPVASAAPDLGQVSAQWVATLFRDEHWEQTLEALAATMLPADDFDGGVQDLGFASVAEMRSRYEAGRADLYRTALEAVDRMARMMFDQPNFIALAPAERTALLEAIRQNQVNGEVWGPVKPATFFGALWEDVIFLYCTHPDTWERIGFPGPSFDTGGHGDFDQPQQVKGQG